MPYLYSSKIYSLDKLLECLPLVSEKQLWSFFSDDQLKISPEWVDAADQAFQKMSNEEHFDLQHYSADYLNYLRDHRIEISLEAVRQIEAAQRMYIFSKSGAGGETRISKPVLLGIQNWYLIHLAIEKNPGSVSKFFETLYLDELIASVGSFERTELKENMVLEHIAPLLKISEHFLATRNTALGKYLKLIFQKLIVSEDRKVILDTIAFARYLRQMTDKSMHNLMKNHLEPSYRLILILKDLKVII
jgi:hypothetical protein